jgi:hypothetical protein
MGVFIWHAICNIIFMKNTIKIIVAFSLFFTGAELISKPQRPTENPQVQKPQVEKPRFPKHWGHPPRLQVRDHVKLPGKFGEGSSTLAKWIADNLKRDANKERPGKEEPNPQPKPKPPVEPISPIVPVPPAEVKNKIDLYRMGQKRMQDGLKARISELGKNPSREEVREAVEDYKKNNKQLIEWQKELGKDIQDWHKDNKPSRPKRPAPTEEIREKIEKVKETEKALEGVRKAFHDALKRSKDLTKEDRDELVREFKDANAEKHRAIKEAQKELQEKIRETKQDGDRRK